MVIAFLCLPVTKISFAINLTMGVVNVQALLLKVFIPVFYIYIIYNYLSFGATIRLNT